MNITINNKIYNITIINNKKDRIRNLFFPNKSYVLLKSKNSFNTYIYFNCDFIVLDKNMVITHIYRNLPKYKIIKLKENKTNVNILILPKNTSVGLRIGNILKIV